MQVFLEFCKAKLHDHLLPGIETKPAPTRPEYAYETLSMLLVSCYTAQGPTKVIARSEFYRPGGKGARDGPDSGRRRPGISKQDVFE
jgi:hypothetical protein